MHQQNMAKQPRPDLVDINADGLPDLVYTPEDGQHRFYLNRVMAASRRNRYYRKTLPPSGCVMP